MSAVSSSPASSCSINLRVEEFSCFEQVALTSGGSDISLVSLVQSSNWSSWNSTFKICKRYCSILQFFPSLSPYPYFRSYTFITSNPIAYLDSRYESNTLIVNIYTNNQGIRRKIFLFSNRTRRSKRGDNNDVFTLSSSANSFSKLIAWLTLGLALVVVLVTVALSLFLIVFRLMVLSFLSRDALFFSVKSFFSVPSFFRVFSFISWEASLFFKDADISTSALPSSTLLSTVLFPFIVDCWGPLLVGSGMSETSSYAADWSRSTSEGNGISEIPKHVGSASLTSWFNLDTESERIGSVVPVLPVNELVPTFRPFISSYRWSASSSVSFRGWNGIIDTIEPLTTKYSETLNPGPSTPLLIDNRAKSLEFR